MIFRVPIQLLCDHVGGQYIYIGTWEAKDVRDVIHVYNSCQNVTLPHGKPPDILTTAVNVITLQWNKSRCYVSQIILDFKNELMMVPILQRVSFLYRFLACSVERRIICLVGKETVNKNMRQFGVAHEI